MSKPFQGFRHGTGQIVLTNPSRPMRPVEIHLKEDGTKDDQPSLCIVMRGGYHDVDIYGEISVRMFNEGLSDIGYELIKVKTTDEVEENKSEDTVQH